MEQENRKGWSFSKEQYKELAKWAEKMALILFAAIVVQHIVDGIQLSQPSVFFGYLWTTATYAIALIFLKKS